MEQTGREPTYSQRFESVVVQHRESMIRTVWRATRDHFVAEDAMQMALLNLWQRMDFVSTHPNPRALILRICLDSVWENLRRKRRFDPISHGPDSNGGSILEDFESRSQTPLEELEAREAAHQLLRAIQRLPTQQRTAMWLKYIEHCETPEIAQAMGCSDATVRKHLEKGRRTLRTELQPYFHDFVRE
jgi:RNA polymerase sigma factor (sigma-70 family)